VSHLREGGCRLPPRPHRRSGLSSVFSVYRKLRGAEVATWQGVVRHIACEARTFIEALNSGRHAQLAGLSTEIPLRRMGARQRLALSRCERPLRAPCPGILRWSSIRKRAWPRMSFPAPTDRFGSGRDAMAIGVLTFPPGRRDRLSEAQTQAELPERDVGLPCRRFAVRAALVALNFYAVVMEALRTAHRTQAADGTDSEYDTAARSPLP
jgi:hypothetical protein